jgi:hypothetical protein
VHPDGDAHVFYGEGLSEAERKEVAGLAAKLFPRRDTPSWRAEWKVRVGWGGVALQHRPSGRHA